MKYDILRTEKADTQIRKLINYIAEDSGNIDIALGYLDKLEHGITLLEEQPYLGVVPRDLTLKRLKFRVLIVEKHLIFYKVRERDGTIIIYAVVDSRQDYMGMIL